MSVYPDLMRRMRLRFVVESTVTYGRLKHKRIALIGLCRRTKFMGVCFDA